MEQVNLICTPTSEAGEMRVTIFPEKHDAVDMMLGAELGMENQQMTGKQNVYDNPHLYTMMQQ
ncbi:hypothetical protein KIN20_016746 [Parelaphostrongylus tenuis]|uniref:Uncharacterized protein n=1 Tax=Parelaphostrongylus tenuis TaxID=148309 RepID=A0AAD5MM19_PARTN|nr:hypothetical protein KIN20_016746 [Parelaphostrongylus tenuis]